MNGIELHIFEASKEESSLPISGSSLPYSLTQLRDRRSDPRDGAAVRCQITPNSCLFDFALFQPSEDKHQSLQVAKDGTRRKPLCQYRCGLFKPPVRSQGEDWKIGNVRRAGGTAVTTTTIPGPIRRNRALRQRDRVNGQLSFSDAVGIPERLRASGAPPTGEVSNPATTPITPFTLNLSEELL